jgi:ectoine hydroxylase-related dioxygenase (phytanoyl-CoA dioxygenase family)
VSDEFYGAIPQTVVHSALEGHLEELAIQGFTVLPDVVPPSELAVLRTKLDAVYEAQRKEGEPTFTLEDIQEENQVRAPLCYDDHFVEIARHPRVLEVVRAALGNYFLVHLQIGIINAAKTKNRQSIWHRDLLFQDWVISKPLAVSAMLCIDDFNERTGGTYVVPFTHKVERMPSREYTEKHGITIEAKAGSVFVMDSMLVHRAGYNGADATRRGLNTIYGCGLLKQQISLPSQLDGRFADDPLLHMLLGYDAEPSPSVHAWRERRFGKQRK